MATRAFDCSPISLLVSAAALTVGGSSAFSCGPVSSLDASCALFGSAKTLTASPFTGLSAACSLQGSSSSLSAAPVSSLKACANLTGASDTRGMSLCEVLSDLLMMWGMDRLRTAPAYAVNRAITDVNNALQTLWNRAEERTYWTESTLTVTLASEQASIALPDAIQNVNGPCRIAATKRELTPAGTLAELDAFSVTYLDGDAASQPAAYHIERGRQDATDPAGCTLHVTPAPTEETNLVLEVTLEAPRYTAGDLATCPLLPIPHRYVESLLLPIARYRAASFYHFERPELMPKIEAEYGEAMRAIGLADPLPGNSGDQRNRRGDEA